MFRRSSPRALISTRHTVCLPFSDASISAGTSGDSSLVRYTVDFSAITSGSCAHSFANDSKLAANESYGWWTMTSPARMTANCSSASTFASGGRATGTHGSSLRSGRSSFVSSLASSRSMTPATG